MRKINTIPNGIIVIITVAIFLLISLLLTIIVIPEDVVYPMIFLDVISLTWIADLFITVNVKISLPKSVHLSVPSLILV